MAIHSPACEAYLAELSTEPAASVEFQMASVVGRLYEHRALGYLLTVIYEDPRTRAADIAHRLWALAANNTIDKEIKR
ncbi:hypothetical protein ACIP5Y_21300 [Nocardia sp. NPDC088792]|uniref:hypothetical protein n=1 Tax=Nocardia sp. NPDC088792 TaxID=3364332 RepID=UPI00382C7856